MKKKKGEERTYIGWVVDAQEIKQGAFLVYLTRKDCAKYEIGTPIKIEFKISDKPFHTL